MSRILSFSFIKIYGHCSLKILSEAFHPFHAFQLNIFNSMKKRSFDFLRFPKHKSQKIKILASITGELSMSFHFLLRPLKSLSFSMNSNECTTREQPENCEKEQSNDFQMIYNKKINKKSSIINITAAGILNERKGFLSVPTSSLSTYVREKSLIFLRKMLVFLIFAEWGKILAFLLVRSFQHQQHRA